MLVAYFLLVVASLVSADEPVYSKCTGAGLTITSAKGHITSPNYPEKYPANQDCKWILKPPIGVSLRLRVDHLNNKEVFDGGDATCYDSLRISTGRKDEPFKYIDKGGLCAVTASDLSQDIFEIQNSENKTKLTKIEFASDYSDHLTGFSISFNALCNESLFGELGSFKSPGFPRSYPNNAECYFTIKTPVGTHIEIEFNTFRLEKLACETDYVIIGIGAADDINENKEKYCGYISPGSLRFPFHKITLLFVSGPDNSEQGFEATWKAVSADSPTTTVLPATTMPVAKNCSYTNTNKTCQRWDETYPHSPKHTPKDKNHNYCRNPDNDPRGYWCYTTDPDTRWEYCDFQNCIENNATTASINDSSTTDKSTTVNITTASEATTSEASTTANVKVVPKITGGGSEAPDITLDNGTVSAIQHVSPDASGLPWFVYLIGALCVLVILFILVFVWRRKRTKRQTLITDGTLENSVQFNQTQIALEDHKENTYVEIPYAGRPPRPKPRRNRNACEEFPEKRINDSCVTPRINEISVASLDNPASFASTSLQGQTSGFRNESYSISNDVGPSSRIASAVNKVLYNMAEEVDDVQVEENLYQTIELGDQEVIPSADEKVASPVTTITTAVKTSDSKQGSGKKLWKKPFLRMFGNQNETDRQKNTSRDNLSRENPFDTDDEEQQVSGPSKKQDSTESYSLSSGDRNPPSSQYHLSNKSVLENKTATQEFTDPIIVDPVTHSPLPDDASMICISPAIIDNNFEGEDNNIFIKDVLYSVPNPTSPEFPIEGFIYDVPVNTSRSNSESTKSDTHSPSLKGYEERDNSSTSESENNNSTPAYGLNGRQSQVEYCTMNSVPLLQKKHKKKQTRCSPPKNVNKNRQENIRHSLLYTSMKENTTERHKSESKGKEVYENIAKPRQSL